MKKILLPVDFSDLSRHTCRFALQLASQLKAQVTMIHVHPNLVLNQAHTSWTQDEMHEQENISRKQLEELYLNLSHYAEANNLSVQLERTFISGLPEENILQFSQADNADLIVLCSSYLNEDVLLSAGPLCSTLLEESKVPVLMVPEELNVENIQNVIFPSLFQERDLSVVAQVKELLHSLNISIKCIPSLTENTEEKEQTYIKEKIMQLSETGAIAFEMAHQEDRDELLKYLTSGNYDMIVLSPLSLVSSQGILNYNLLIDFLKHHFLVLTFNNNSVNL